MFALLGSFMSQVSVDLQSAFAAKGGQPGCGLNEKAITASDGKCLKEPKEDDDIPEEPWHH